MNSMAIMIPSEGGYFDPASKEKEMFDALSTLPDDYFVFHSYRLVNLIPDKGLNENEIDFLVFNLADDGLLLLWSADLHECHAYHLLHNNQLGVTCESAMPTSSADNAAGSSL